MGVYIRKSFWSFFAELSSHLAYSNMLLAFEEWMNEWVVWNHCRIHTPHTYTTQTTLLSGAVSLCPFSSNASLATQAQINQTQIVEEIQHFVKDSKTDFIKATGVREMDFSINSTGIKSGWLFKHGSMLKEIAERCWGERKLVNVIKPFVSTNWCMWKLGFYLPRETGRQGPSLHDHISKG